MGVKLLISLWRKDLCRLRMLENKMSGSIFESKREEVPEVREYYRIKNFITANEEFKHLSRKNA
jgi:hypothetical protein